MTRPAEDDLLPTPAFLEAFTAAADASGALPFDRFMDLALYHPQLGYYRGERLRVGRAPETDFYTASSTGPVFGELVHDACGALLGRDRLHEFIFVELGAETGRGVLDGVPHAFAGARLIGIGEPITLAGRCVVFSNELFDAQPFRRFRFRDRRWRELGVRRQGSALVEIEIEGGAPPSVLPSSAAEGCTLDLPLAAAELAGVIAREPWTGLFLAFDYGKSWAELTAAHPAGTARAYHRHRQGNDLLARPGRQDLTCHVCWDWLADALAGQGFSEPKLESQESFFVRQAGDYLAQVVAGEAATLSRRKLSVFQLLHHLGQKFQVLRALREK